MYIHKHKRNFVTKILADVILAWFSWAKVSLGRKFQPRNFWWCKDLAWFSCVKTAFGGTLHTSSYDVMFLCMHLCIYGVGPYIHEYIRKNTMIFGSRMCTSVHWSFWPTASGYPCICPMTCCKKSYVSYYVHEYISPNTNTQSIFTNTHKYENPSQTYTNTSLLTYIST